MGSWQFEVGKMVLYIFFPVAMFHVFNQPQFFEKWVTDTKREIYPPDSDSDIQYLRKAIEEVKQKQRESDSSRDQ